VQTTRAHLELAIEVDSDPISGSVSNGAHGAQAFVGWIELTAAIEAARSSVAVPGGAEAIGGQTLGSFPGAKDGEL
jgi:hypothetical protein